MRISYFIAGLIFLLNPNYGILDVLPDLFGYLLLVKAIEHAADLYEYLADAKGHIMRLALISLFKMASLALCEVTDETFILVLTFTFAILESIYMFAAFIKLYDGLAYSAMRLNLSNLSERASKLKIWVLSFFVVRNVFAVLPELTSLLYSAKVIYENPEFPQIFKEYLSYLMIPLTGIFAIVVGVKMIRFLLDCKREMFCMMLERTYELQFAERHGLFRARKLANAGFFTSVAVLFSLDFHYKMMDVIPDALAAVLLLAVIFTVARRNIEKIIGSVSCAAYMAFSILNMRAFYAFGQEYDISDVFYTYSTTEKYRELEIFAGFELLFGILCFSIALILIYRIAKGTVVTYAGRLYAINPDNCAADFTSEVKRSMIVDIILGVLHFFGKLVYVLVLPIEPAVTVLSAITTLLWSLHLASHFTLIRQGVGDKIKDL